MSFYFNSTGIMEKLGTNDIFFFLNSTGHMGILGIGAVFSLLNLTVDMGLQGNFSDKRLEYFLLVTCDRAVP